MARAEGEPSTKRAKVDETDEEEDALVRRKEEVVRLLEIARRPFPPARKGEGKSKREKERKRKGIARAKQELLTLCARLEAKNEKLLGRLLPELWQKIVDEYLHQNDELALAMTCRFFREKQKDLGKKMETNVGRHCILDLRKSVRMPSHSLGWFRWVCDTFEILPGFTWPHQRAKGGAVYGGDLVNYAAFQGIEILRWLMEEKGCKLNGNTGEWAGFGGSVEVLEYLLGKGYEFDEGACRGAARTGQLEALKFLRGLSPRCPWNWWACFRAAQGGHLEVLKWARSQDPPCPWDEWTCSVAAQEGHLEVLKWARSQDPPCPWGCLTCSYAAGRGHLEVLKWARSQDPPCPWDEWTCSEAAKKGHLEVLKWARSQDPPCRWDERTCALAAQEGHLEVLKWARSEDPPCPWSRSECRETASNYGHEHIVKWINQRRQSDE